jgi:hypothetical protein
VFFLTIGKGENTTFKGGQAYAHEVVFYENFSLFQPQLSLTHPVSPNSELPVYLNVEIFLFCSVKTYKKIAHFGKMEVPHNHTKGAISYE